MMYTVYSCIVFPMYCMVVYIHTLFPVARCKPYKSPPPTGGVTIDLFPVARLQIDSTGARRVMYR